MNGARGGGGTGRVVYLTPPFGICLVAVTADSVWDGRGSDPDQLCSWCSVSYPLGNVCQVPFAMRVTSSNARQNENGSLRTVLACPTREGKKRHARKISSSRSTSRSSKKKHVIYFEYTAFGSTRSLSRARSCSPNWKVMTSHRAGESDNQ